MPWHPDIAPDLPAPRDDEPESLRRDIADELADHLQSAFVREQHGACDKVQAKENVLQKFGNPSQVARKLWFDAMWEKIMSQRVSLVLSSLMTVVCLAVLAVVVLMFREFQAVNSALVDRLAALGTQQSPPTPAPQSLDWQPVTMKLVLDKPGGAPAVGFKVSLDGKLLGTDKSITVERTTGANGLADWALVHVGEHTLSVQTPWDELTVFPIVVTPGMPPTDDIVCPSARPQPAEAKCLIDWPEDLRQRIKQSGLWTLIDFSQAARRMADHNWHWGEAWSKRVLFGPSGESYLLNNADVFQLQTAQRVPLDNLQHGQQPLVEHTRLYMAFSKRLEPRSTFPVITYPYMASQLVLFANDQNLLPPDTPSDEKPAADSVPKSGRTESIAAFRWQSWNNRADQSNQPLEFEAHAGTVNHWNVTPPEPMVALLRERLTKDRD